MVTPDSRPRLVSGLERANGEVFDRAMSRRIRVNGVGEFVMDGMDGAAPVSRLAAEVSERFAVAGQTALADTIAFVDSLERCELVNIRHPLGDYLRAALGSVLTLDGAVLRECAALFAAGERVDIRGRSFAVIAARIGLRLYRRQLPLATCSILLYGGSIFALLGDPVYSFLIPALVYGVALFGMVLHEGAHLYVLRRCSGEERLGYLRVAPLEMGICYPCASPETSFRVAMAGPLLPTVCGAVLYLVNALYPSPLFAAAALLLVVHVLSFLPLVDSDGKHLLTYATAPHEDLETGSAGEP
jgi:hypothetical protein